QRDALAGRHALAERLRDPAPAGALDSLGRVTEPAHRPLTDDEEVLGAELPSVLSLVTDEQRIARMAAEIEMGFKALHGIQRGVSVFGSARTPPGSAEYELAREVGRRLGRAGFTVITGGGPG